MRNPDTTLRNTYGVTLRTVTTRIARTFDQATPAEIEAGAAWYPETGSLAGDLALQSGRSKDCAAAVISHLSPRLQWARNVLAAHTLLVEKEALPGTLSRGIAKAEAAISRDQNMLGVDESTFGPKTLRFYLNIMGSREDVTVDVWALRAAGLDDTYLGRKGVYEALEYAYQLAAARRSVEPSTMQATTWVVVRGGHA